MAGISNVNDDESIMYGDNASFDGTPRTGALNTNGQLWIGSTALPHVVKGSIVSTIPGFTIGYSSPNITLNASGGALVQSITAGPGVTITGTATNPIVNSMTFTDSGAAFLLVNHAYFIIGAVTQSCFLPASPAQGDTLTIVNDTTAVGAGVTLTLGAGQNIRIGSQTSPVGDVSSAVRGDSLTISFRASTSTWIATAVIGTWIGF